MNRDGNFGVIVQSIVCISTLHSGLSGYREEALLVFSLSNHENTTISWL